MCHCVLQKKAKISTCQILFTPKTLNFDIAKNTSLKVCINGILDGHLIERYLKTRAK